MAKRNWVGTRKAYLLAAAKPDGTSITISMDFTGFNRRHELEEFVFHGRGNELFKEAFAEEAAKYGYDLSKMGCWGENWSAWRSDKVKRVEDIPAPVEVPVSTGEAPQPAPGPVSLGLETGNVRISKKLKKNLPATVVQVLDTLQERYSSIKSFYYSTQEVGHKVWMDEDVRVTAVYGDVVETVEVVGSHNFGAAGLYYKIGEGVQFPVGTLVFLVRYYGRDGYQLAVINIMPKALEG